MTEPTLTPRDIREIIASILLSTLDQGKRLTFAMDDILPADFSPEQEGIPELDEIWSTITTFFGVTLERPPGTITDWANGIHAHRKETGTITFSTSGSTGAPKATTHSFQLLTQEAQALGELFRDRQRVVSLVPPHHIYGLLFSILLPKTMDVPMVRQAPLPLPGLADFLEPGDLVVAFPLLWNGFLKQGIPFKNDIHGVTSTGPCPPETIDTLIQRGLSIMHEIYGSSETGGIGHRESPRQGYVLLPYWQRTDSDGELLRTHPNLPPTPHPLQDTLSWDGEEFIPERRIDDCVQVAGINVSPGAVCETLLQHPDVRECSVRLMRPKEGERLKAFVVPASADAASDMPGRLKAWAKARLSPHEIPGTITLGEKLPMNQMGKLSDW